MRETRRKLQKVKTAKMKTSKTERAKGITLIALVITIIVLLILAGVTIATLTGQNGILSNATKSKEETSYRSAEEKIKLAINGSYDATGSINESNFETEVTRLGGSSTIEGTEANVQIDGYGFLVDLTTGKIEIGESEGDITGPVEQPENTPEYWEATRKTDSEWYSYVDLTSNTKVKVNKPQLKGNMTSIKYTGEAQEGSKWANAMTTDGSMWAWVPRYAYKITQGYHTNTAGTIEVAFLDTNNNFLNSTDTGAIETNPSNITYTNGVQDQWLVHPAFTASKENGGGFGELAGMWVAKFEASGTNATNLAVKPGVSSLRSQTVNTFYHYGKEAKYGETESLNSHMMKNSEWGAVAYLTHSKYGRNKEELTVNTSGSYYTGGTTDKNIIYTTNANQSTTKNATGIYDLSGGSYEYVASYVNNGNSSLSSYAGTTKEDLYGADAEERGKSTAYKTVYKVGSSDSDSNNYSANNGVKGDAVYETSNSYSGSNSWNGDYSCFPYSGGPVFLRGGYYGSGSNAGAFSFYSSLGNSDGYMSFRPVLAF